MRLTLTMQAWPDGGKPELREIEGELAIGRGSECDWVLTDAKSRLSRRHCVLAPTGDVWRVTDCSLNGTFLNEATQPIGRGASQNLHDGDRIRLGAYVLEARYDRPAALQEQDAMGAPSHDPLRSPMFPSDNPFRDAPGETWNLPGGWSGASTPGGAAPGFPPNNRIPDDFSGAPVADHSPAMSDAWHAPPPGRVVLPDDWDLETPAAVSPQGGNGLLPDDWDADPAQSGTPASAIPGGAQAAGAVPQGLAARGVDAVPRDVAEPGAPAAAPSEAALLAAFRRGAKLDRLAPADAEAFMESLGATMRVMVDRLRAVQMSRAAIKREFRILGTMFQPGDNNPVRFAANTDAALQQLLTARRRPDLLVGDLLDGIRLHELAMIAAMRQAVAELLNTLSPEKVREAIGEERALESLLPLQRKARAFDQYETLHAKISQALSDDFDSVFGKAFARAYERVMSADDRAAGGRNG